MNPLAERAAKQRKANEAKVLAAINNTPKTAQQLKPICKLGLKTIYDIVKQLQQNGAILFVKLPVGNRMAIHYVLNLPANVAHCTKPEDSESEQLRQRTLQQLKAVHAQFGTIPIVWVAP